MVLRTITQFALASVIATTAVATSAPVSSPNAAPSNTATVRFATFNASLNRNNAGQLVTDLSMPDNQQAKNVAEIIQRTAPDVVLINEFDYVADGSALRLFQQNYLGIGQNGAPAATYPYSYTAESNTGIASGFDLNNDGQTITTPGAAGYGDDALGFGVFPGQYGMALYSKYPIESANIRTFQKFLWKDMPGALLPDDPATSAANDWYNAEEQAILRLSSKSHWDVPINVNGTVIHTLVSHPTPPVFDGPEDRNGKRNRDEIRLWADYVSGKADYLYDDKGTKGGLTTNANFVIMGDQNADPEDGDSFDEAILQLLDLPQVNISVTPASEGGPEQSAAQGGKNAEHTGDPAFDTADFDDRPTGSGNLRADYVLPSAGIRITNAAVFWPKSDDPLFRLVGLFNSTPSGFPSSDHRLVWADLSVPAVVAPKAETPPVLDTGELPAGARGGDADDPAIYVHPTDRSKGLVVAALKEGGLDVYNLAGQVVQSITPAGVRYNNVDVAYNVPLGNERIDIAVASDRFKDNLAIYRINPATGQLSEIGDQANPLIFTPAGQQPNQETTAYGLALYRSPTSGKTFAFVSQREADTVVQLELTDNGAGKLRYAQVRSFKLPIPTGGELEDAQIEGMVADGPKQILYIAQENVGIWKVGAEPGTATAPTIVDRVYPGGGNLKADAEGLTIYYTSNGKGYLLASSQGDNTFAVYTREGANTYLGSFRVGDATGIDGVQESDGADIINLPLGPNYPSGLLVVHDGSNDPAVLVKDDGELENISTNFKFVSWGDVAGSFPAKLLFDTTTYDPRSPNRSVLFAPIVSRPR